MKVNKYIVWAVVILPSLGLLFSGVGKIFSPEMVSKNMPGSGFVDHMLELGLLEIACTALYLVPATRRIGFYLLCSYLGGAIALHIHLKDYSHLAGPIIFEVLVWIGAYLSFPDFGKSVPTAEVR